LSATLGTASVSTALLRLPRFGAWVAEVSLTDDTALAVGSRQTLTIGDLSLVGTVTDGGDFGGRASYTVVGGAGAWGTVLPAHPYHDDAGVMLSAVFADLAVAAGELGTVLEVANRILGRDWTRPVGAARDQLDALTTPRGQWWIANDGTTHLGPRPSSSLAAPGTLSVASFDPQTVHAVVQDANDAIAALAPGASLTAPGLPAALSIAAVAVRVEPGGIEVDLWGESPLSELLTRLVDARTAWRLFMPSSPFAVQAVAADGRVQVQPADQRAASLPGEPLVGHAPGLPGASYTLAPGAPVLLAFVGGDPGSPVVVGHPTPGALPASTALAASIEIDITAPLVQLGAPGGSPVVINNGNALGLWLAAVQTALALLGHDPGIPPVISATKVKAT
jgi:hypothetical protein